MYVCCLRTDIHISKKRVLMSWSKYQEILLKYRSMSFILNEIELQMPLLFVSLKYRWPFFYMILKYRCHEQVLHKVASRFNF